MLQHTFYWVYAYRKSHRVYHNNQDSRIVSKYVLLKNKTIFVLCNIFFVFKIVFTMRQLCNQRWQLIKQNYLTRTYLPKSNKTANSISW